MVLAKPRRIPHVTVVELLHRGTTSRKSFCVMDLTSTTPELDVVSEADDHINELAAVLIVLVGPVVAVTRELPVAEDQLNLFLDRATVRRLAKRSEVDPAALAVTTRAGIFLSALCLVGRIRLPDVVQRRDVNTSAQLALVDLPSVVQGLATVGLDLRREDRLVDVLAISPRRSRTACHRCRVRLCQPGPCSSEMSSSSLVTLDAATSHLENCSPAPTNRSMTHLPFGTTYGVSMSM